MPRGATSSISKAAIGYEYLLDCSRDLPQDICIYRNGKPWLYATTHEKELTLLNPTEADKALFALQERN